MNRKLYMFLTGRAIVGMADQLKAFVIPLYIYNQSHSLSLSGLAIAVEWLPRVLLYPFMGVLSDKRSFRSQFLIIDLGRTLLCIVLSIVFPNIVLLIGSSLINILNSYSFVLTENYLGQTISPEVRPQVQSNLQSIEQTTRVLGPALAGYLSLYLGLLTIMKFSAVAFLLGSLLSIPAILSESRASSGTASIFESLKIGSRILINSMDLIILTAASIGINLISGVVLAVSPAVIKTTFHLPDGDFGKLTSVGAATTILILLLFGRLSRQVNLQVASKISIVGIGIGAFGLSFAHNIIEYTIAFSIMNMSMGIFSVYLRTQRINLIPSEHLGKTMGLLLALILGAMPISGLIVAFWGSTVGPQTLILSISLFISILFSVSICRNWFLKFKKN